MVNIPLKAPLASLRIATSLTDCLPRPLDKDGTGHEGRDMATESPEGSDPRLENGSLGAALLRRLPRILLVTIVLVVATYLVLPFIPMAREPVGKSFRMRRNSIGAGRV